MHPCTGRSTIRHTALPLPTLAHVPLESSIQLLLEDLLQPRLSFSQLPGSSLERMSQCRETWWRPGTQVMPQSCPTGKGSSDGLAHTHSRTFSPSFTAISASAIAFSAATLSCQICTSRASVPSGSTSPWPSYTIRPLG